MVIVMQPSMQINKSELPRFIQKVRTRTRIMHSIDYSIGILASVGGVLGKYHTIPAGFFGVALAFIVLELLAIWSIEPISKKEVARLKKLQSKTVIINSYALSRENIPLQRLGFSFLGSSERF